MLPLPNPEDFRVIERDGLRLINPRADRNNDNGIWTLETVHFRSRIEDIVTRETVSQGFPKFGNLGYGPDTFRVTMDDVVQACQDGHAFATLKVDGSLLIRSVHKGKVIYRTRGAFDYAHQENAGEVNRFRVDYPKLEDPTYRPNESLLFEWVSPKNVIVIKYPEPDITLIGAIHHQTFQMARLCELLDIAEDTNIPLVDAFPMSVKGWDRLLDECKDRADIEGYVIRFADEQRLVKIKCSPYLTKHALKDTMSDAKLAELWVSYGSPPQAEFHARFSRDFNEETLLWALPMIEEFYEGVHIFEDRLRHAQTLAQTAVTHGTAQKDFALRVQETYGKGKWMAFCMMAYTQRPIDPAFTLALLLQTLEGRTT
jgi:hypothetical protein